MYHLIPKTSKLFLYSFNPSLHHHVIISNPTPLSPAPPPPPHTHQLILFANTKLPLTQFVESNHKTFVHLFIENPAKPTMYEPIPAPISTLYTVDQLYSQINFTVHRVRLSTVWSFGMGYRTIRCFFRRSLQLLRNETILVYRAIALQCFGNLGTVAIFPLVFSDWPTYTKISPSVYILFQSTIDNGHCSSIAV